MVIKLRSIINKIISISVCVLLSFSIYKKCYQQSQAPKNIVVQTDSLWTDQTSCALTTFIQTNTHSLDSSSFYQSLLTQFPSVSSYALEHNPSGFVACIVQASEPILSINNAWALTNDGRLAPLTDFSSPATQSLRNVLMPQFLITQAFRTSIQKLPYEIFKSYNVVWINDQEALLHDRSQPHFAIRFNADSLPEETIMYRCNAIKKDLEMRNIFASAQNKKKSYQCIADIRFKNQIVISWGMEGAGYG